MKTCYKCAAILKFPLQAIECTKLFVFRYSSWSNVKNDSWSSLKFTSRLLYTTILWCFNNTLRNNLINKVHLNDYVSFSLSNSVHNCLKRNPHLQCEWMNARNASISKYASFHWKSGLHYTNALHYSSFSFATNLKSYKHSVR